MFEAILMDFDTKFPGKSFLTIEEVAAALDCPKRVVYNWWRRTDPAKRPPFLQSGKWIRVPKRPFILWLIQDQESFSKA
jgi:hypothetical protein